MLKSSSCNLDKRLGASVHQNQKIIQLLLSYQISFLLGDEYTLTDLKELFSAWQLLVHNSLTDSIEDDSDKSSNRDNDRCIETNDRKLQRTAKERADNFLVINENDKILLILNLLFRHFCLILFSEFLLDLTGGLFSFLSLVFHIYIILSIPRVKNTRSVTKISCMILTSTTVTGTERECPIVDRISLSIKL